MSGYTTNGLTAVTPPLTGSEQAAFDTQLTQGLAPESVAISTAQLKAYAQGYSAAATTGAVTQATNRTTGVTLSTTSGQITTSSASLAAEAAAEFTVTNTLVAIGDVIAVSIQSGTNGGNTDVFVSTVAAGSYKIKVANNNAASGTAETGAIIINVILIKAAV